MGTASSALGRRVHLHALLGAAIPAILIVDFLQGSESTSAFCIQRRIGPCRRVIGFRCHSATLSPAAPVARHRRVVVDRLAGRRGSGDHRRRRRLYHRVHRCPCRGPGVGPHRGDVNPWAGDRHRLDDRRGAHGAAQALRRVSDRAGAAHALNRRPATPPWAGETGLPGG